MKRLSKGFYVGSIAIGLGLGLLLGILGTVMMTLGEPKLGVLFAGVASIPLLYGSVVFMVLIHKMWASIQDGHARMSPRKAIGFLFIPLFNIYWWFQVIWGFAKDFNSFIDRHSVSATQLSGRLHLTFCTLGWLGIIPVVGVVLVVVNYMMGIAIVLEICEGVNAIVEPKRPLSDEDKLSIGDAAQAIYVGTGEMNRFVNADRVRINHDGTIDAVELRRAGFIIRD